MGQANPIPRHNLDFVTIYLAAPGRGSHRKGNVVFAHGGSAKLNLGERTVVIELKNHPIAPLPNASGYPLAFPRPQVKKVLENDHTIVWSYAWYPGKPTPMLHDKDVVVIYMGDRAVKSITPDGNSTVNEYTAFQTKFNLRDRTHRELLTRGTGSAIMTELK